MKAASISVRIADFLKEYAPFSYLDKESLVNLAKNGKVKFHEDGEIVFSQGQPRDKWLYVIQQGKVRIIDEEGGEEKLIDYRGQGDMLGLQGIRGEDPYLHTCKTETEVILYALPREEFVDLAQKSFQAKRFLAAYFSLNPVFSWDESDESSDLNPAGLSPVTLRKGGLFEVRPPHEVARNTLVTIHGGTPVREVAKKLQSKRVDCVLVVNGKGHPIGKLTDADLRDRIIEEKIDPSRSAIDVMFTDLVPAHPSDNTGELLVKLTRSGKHFLIVTEDGTLKSKAIGIVSERNLFLHYGRFPTVIGEAIASAPDIITLRRLRDRMESLILEFLEDRSALTWLMELVGVLNRKLTQRLVDLSLEEMKASGLGTPPVDFTWLAMGSGGRDELLIRSAVYHALVYDADKREEPMHSFFTTLAQKVGAGLRQCGFLESTQGVLAQNEGWCLPLSEMKAKYRNFIENPVESHVYHARDAFDFRPLAPKSRMADALRKEIRDCISKNPDFIRFMARDSLQNQPPRTLFRGYVVDDKGIEKEELAIKFHALLPLVDVARVLALESGNSFPTGTMKRLRNASERLKSEDEEGSALLREAAEAFKIAQFARISRGLLAGTDGAIIRPANLDVETRTLLVTAFRTILSVLEYTANRFELNLRK